MEQPLVISNSTGAITAQWEFITPAIAGEWLENHNHVNRPKRKKHGAQLQGDMEDDLWEDNGETIVFDSAKELVNGQHRLLALLASGTTHEFLVVRGVRPEVRSTVDANAKRTFADDLAQNGVDNAVIREGLVRQFIKWDRFAGLADESWRPSRRMMSTRYPKYASELDSVLAETQRWMQRWPGNTQAMRFTYWLLVKRLDYNEKIVTRFFSTLALGSQDPDDAMLVRMRAKIAVPVSVSSNGRFTHMPVGVEVFWLIQAWNRWVTGSHAHYSSPKGGITDPYPMPEALK